MKLAKKVVLKAALPVKNKKVNVFLSDDAVDESSIIAWHESKQLEFSYSNKVISFIMPEINEKTEARIFFNVKNPVVYSLYLENSSSGGPMKSYAYALAVENTLSSELASLPLVIQLSIPADAVLADDFGRKLPFTVVLNGFSFKAGFYPLQKRNFSISFTTPDGLFFNKLLLESRLELTALKNSENQSLSGEAETLLGRLDSLQANDLASLQAISFKANELMKKNDALLEDYSLFIARKEAFMNDLNKSESMLGLLAGIGFEKEAVDYASVLSDAGKKAELLGSKAIENPLQAISGLDRLEKEALIDLAKPSNALLEEKNSLKERIALLSRTADENTLSALRDLSAGLDSASNEILHGRLAGAETIIAGVKKSLSVFDSDASAGAKAKALSLLEKASVLSGGMDEKTLLKKISFLDSLLSMAATLEELKQFGYSPSFNEGKLASLRKAVESLGIGEFSKNLARMKALVEKGGFDEAINFNELFFSGLEDKAAEFALIEKEADSLMQGLKDDALIAFDSAKSKVDGNPLASSEAKKLLLASQKAIDSQDYLESILLSVKAKSLEGRNAGEGMTGLIALPQISEVNIPLAIIPLLLVIIFSSYWKHRKKKDEDLKATTIQRVLRHC
ncbi:hypothetical protein HZB89_00955 [archaeon]|nr:hypothetical protein [archaeon]